MEEIEKAKRDQIEQIKIKAQEKDKEIQEVRRLNKMTEE